MFNTLATLVVFVASAAAYVQNSRTGLRMIVSDRNSVGLINKIPGKNIITGEVFDPIGFHKNVSPKQLKLWREVELKHGRVAMLAAAGVLAAETGPFSLLFQGKIAGPSTYHMQEIRNIAPYFWIVGIAVIAALELYGINKTWETQDEKTESIAMMKDSHIPGNLGFDPLNLCPAVPEAWDTASPSFYDIREKELNNGRLAMIAWTGMMMQELVDKRTIFAHFQEFGLRYANNPSWVEGTYLQYN